MVPDAREPLAMTPSSISPRIPLETLNAVATAIRDASGLTVTEARTQMARRLESLAMADAQFHPRSLTQAEGATYIAVDAAGESMMLQIGGAAGANHLKDPLWADSTS